MLRRRAAVIVTAALIAGVCALFALTNTRLTSDRTSGNPQYFQDISFHSQTKLLDANNHVDTRFAPDVELSIEETRQSLTDLITSFTQFTNSNNLTFWLAHGTLLGWYWNQKILPWDTDVDVQVLDTALSNMARTFNMTRYQFDGSTSKSFLLDVNSFFKHNSVADPANTIDARWIDTATGKFIDITAVHPQNNNHGAWRCKDGHRYKTADLFPLVSTSFEGMPVLVPRKNDKILQQEYGWRSLSNTHFHWHVFNKPTRLWEPEVWS